MTEHPKTEQINCLKCGKLFYSVDKTRNHVCPKCNHQNTNEYSMRMAKTDYVSHVADKNDKQESS